MSLSFNSCCFPVEDDFSGIDSVDEEMEEEEEEEDIESPVKPAKKATAKNANVAGKVRACFISNSNMLIFE